MDPFTITVLILFVTMTGIWGTAMAGAAMAENCGESPVEPEEGPEEHVI